MAIILLDKHQPCVRMCVFLVFRAQLTSKKVNWKIAAIKSVEWTWNLYFYYFYFEMCNLFIDFVWIWCSKWFLGTVTMSHYYYNRFVFWMYANVWFWKCAIGMSSNRLASRLKVSRCGYKSMHHMILTLIRLMNYFTENIFD